MIVLCILLDLFGVFQMMLPLHMKLKRSTLQNGVVISFHTPQRPKLSSWNYNPAEI